MAWISTDDNCFLVSWSCALSLDTCSVLMPGTVLCARMLGVAEVAAGGGGLVGSRWAPFHPACLWCPRGRDGAQMDNSDRLQGTGGVQPCTSPEPRLTAFLSLYPHSLPLAFRFLSGPHFRATSEAPSVFPVAVRSLLPRKPLQTLSLFIFLAVSFRWLDSC